MQEKKATTITTENYKSVNVEKEASKPQSTLNIVLDSVTDATKDAIAIVSADVSDAMNTLKDAFKKK